MQSSKRLDLYNQIQFNSNKEYQKNKKRLHAVCILEIGSMDIDISSNHASNYNCEKTTVDCCNKSNNTFVTVTNAVTHKRIFGVTESCNKTLRKRPNQTKSFFVKNFLAIKKSASII